MICRALLLVPSIALLGACATAQENPNYQFSSKYGEQDAATTQLATYAPLEPTVAVFETPAMQPEPVQPAPMQPAPSATESVFDADTMEGTPGYQIFVEDRSAPVAPVEDRQAGTPVSYDYSQNVIVADAPTAIQPAETRPYGAALQGYTVVPGDTVYSISRRLCVGVADVTAPNGIGADYAIAIGQTLRLPASRC